MPVVDIVKMIDSQPDLAPFIRVRSGYMRFQLEGTWISYEVSYKSGSRQQHQELLLIHMFY